MFDPPSGRDKLFWMTVAPSDVTKMKAVVFFHHGFGDHSGFCAQELMVTLAKLYNFGCICCDMPGMGRSDGQYSPAPKR
jgi:pimeloyl-ACP methyl ester carboxylesterase